ncbi:hypothetical protein MTR_1g086520 [Medicago truncatula]|uniref:Uncharacterized protein n=1 Tax=Medicago truncatula TaxID=3880 RepID=G7ICT8_MEDTR|nr:hypothetical protein MTR_1g086520 [Medicago truncatula]
MKRRLIDLFSLRTVGEGVSFQRLREGVLFLEAIGRGCLDLPQPLGVVFCLGRGFIDLPQPFGGSLSSQSRFRCVVGVVFCWCCRFVPSEPCRWRPPALGLGFGCLVVVARKSEVCRSFTIKPPSSQLPDHSSL